ncbi:MAG: serine hydrolase, partial [Candidatus Thermoplasmatota archaeon]|nr:serine hydrolase [Candidatus Thermoplasmatota archaeon]
MKSINLRQKIIAFSVVLIFSMAIYQNIYFDKLFDYYEHNGNKEYDLSRDEWSVDLGSEYHMKSEFEAMFSEMENWDYPASSVILVKNGTIVHEKYYEEFSYKTQFNTYSVTKSFTSALVGIAIDKGLISSVNDPIWNYFPNETFDFDSQYKQRVTIHHILTMTSGFDYGEDPALAPAVGGSRADFVLNKPVKYEPGTVWVYDSHAPSILIKIIESQSNMSIFEFANDNLFEPLEISNVYWFQDDSGLAFGGFGLYLTSREMAKLGQLYAQEGIWNGTRIVSQDWVSQSTIDHLEPDVKFIYSTRPTEGYGYLWWIFDSYYL